LLVGAYFDGPQRSTLITPTRRGAAEINILNDVSSATPGDPLCISQRIEIKRALTASVMLR
jgi:hypothetical protein